MTRFLLRRILAMIPVCLGVTFLLFSLLYVTPGDPARLVLGEEATEESLQEFRREHYLDRPLLTRYGLFIYNTVVHQDMGRSYMTRRPVTGEIANTFPVTLNLASGSIVLATVMGLAFGIICAVKQYSIFDNITMVIAMLGISTPLFYLGILLILWFSVQLQWVPSSGFDSLSQRLLPWITLSATSMSIITRMTRSSMLEVIRSDYVRTARAKGQTERVVILKHALRNALIPIITIVGIQFGHLLGGAILTESVFSIPGMGRLAVDAIKARDYPIVQGAVLYIAMAYVVINLLVDLLYAWVDPKLRTQCR
ncbi:MAG: ABC transporter permease [Desulfovibrio sp.]|jgi:peptide/nickel transport system permease protein|nr:ABC transporter permease [Desulfovibrio sp.]